MPPCRHRAGHLGRRLDDVAARVADIGGREPEVGRPPAGVERADPPALQQWPAERLRQRGDAEPRLHQAQAGGKRRGGKERRVEPNMLEQQGLELPVGPRVPGIGDDRLLPRQVRVVAARGLRVGRRVPCQLEAGEFDVVHGIVRHRTEEHGHVDLAAEQRRAQVQRDVDVDLHLQARIDLVQGRHQVGQPALDDRFRHAQPEHRVDAVPGDDIRLDAVEEPFELLRIAEEHLAALRGPEPGRQPFEQGSAEGFLELLYPRGDRGLGEIEDLGSPVDASEAHDRQKSGYLIKIK